MMLALIGGGILVVLGLLLARPLLELMGTPEDVLDKGSAVYADYLRRLPGYDDV